MFAYFFPALRRIINLKDCSYNYLRNDLFSDK